MRLEDKTHLGSQTSHANLHRYVICSCFINAQLQILLTSVVRGYVFMNKHKTPNMVYKYSY